MNAADLIPPFPEDPQIKRLRGAYERHYAIARHVLCVAPAASRSARRYRGARRERFLAVACDACDRAATAVDLARACVDEANASPWPDICGDAPLAVVHIPNPTQEQVIP